MKSITRILVGVVTLAILPILGIQSANAVTANTGAGGTFTYAAGATNQQIALAACEAVNGTGNCSNSSCGNFIYYYKTTEGTCNCAKAIGSYEFIYNNTGYTGVGQDYGQTNSVSVSGNSRFVRKKNTAVCSVADVWLLVNNNLGAALNVSSTISISNPSANIVYRSNLVISATGSVPGLITFYANNKKIPGCTKVTTNVSNIASCNWKPATHGNLTLSAFLIPSDSTYLTSSSPFVNVNVSKRSSAR